MTMKFGPIDRLLGRRRSGHGAAPVAAFDDYEARAPRPQNGIDAIDGWNSAFPPEFGVIAGDRVNFWDDRIVWAAERFGDLGGRRVLELGPLEGAHTYMLDRCGAEVTAVEANKRAFLKCLVTKEIVGLPRAHFLLGDGVLFLEEDTRRWDLVVACGVLYHMIDPLRFLSAVAARTDVLYLWTSYFDLSSVEPGSAMEKGFAEMREDRPFHGETLTLYRRSYLGADRNPEFCGGIFDEPRWMTRESILAALRLLGFTSIEIAHEAMPNPNEPCFSIFARR
jgi:SAM-dependent methyltransferase